MIPAASCGGGEECQNLEVLVPWFGGSCLVSLRHLFSLFSGANTLLGLGRELWEAGKPQDKRFLVPVKHGGVCRIDPCLSKPASDVGGPGLGFAASLHREEGACPSGAGTGWCSAGQEAGGTGTSSQAPSPHVLKLRCARGCVSFSERAGLAVCRSASLCVVVRRAAG